MLLAFKEPPVRQMQLVDTRDNLKKKTAPYGCLREFV